MNLHKRLERLEPKRRREDDSRPPVLLGLIGKTAADVTGLFAGTRSNIIPHEPGEDFDNFVSRARHLLATPWAGIPLILSCAYEDKTNSEAV